MLIIFVGYKIIHDTITQKHEKEVGMLVLDVQNRTHKLVSKLLYQYTIQQDILIKKHKEVASYLNINSYDIDLQEIKKRINEGHEDSPYEIYIADEELTIKNTTFAPDLGFNLSFAQEVFDKHYNEKTIGCSSPILEKSYKRFLSYTDSYYSENGNSKAGILQVSYSYMKSMEIFQDLRKQIDLYNRSKDVKAYIFADYAFRDKLPLEDWLIYKSDLKEVKFRLRNDIELLNKLKKDVKFTKSFIEDGTQYRAVFISSKSVIIDDIQIIHSVLIDESKFYNDLEKFNIWIFLITGLGIVAIFIINNLRKKEVRLSEQDKFVQSSMHEIKTPLSIITLNNELRELEFGKDEYSSEIGSAIKVLKGSYDGMSFAITQDNLNFPIELISLTQIIRDRVEYFKTIAKSNSKAITLKVQSDCKVKISLVELERLIDNNLSNAVKYSTINTTITVLLEGNTLSLHNMGKPIKDKKHIFNKYSRENTVVGGHGLGLNIVKDIADKYSIDITLDSSEENGTTFIYKFKCHTDDI